MELVTSLSIRPAGAPDVDAVLAFWPAAGAPPSATDDAESVGRAVAEGRLLLAEVDGELVGTVYAGFDGWRGSSTASPCTPIIDAGASPRRWSLTATGISTPGARSASACWSSGPMSRP